MTLSGAIFLSFLAFLQRTRQLTRVLQVPHIAVWKLIPEHIRVIAHFFVPLRNMQHPVLHHFGIFNIPQRQHKRYSPLTNRLFRRPTIVSQVKPSYLLLGFLQFVNIYSCHICLIQRANHFCGLARPHGATLKVFLWLLSSFLSFLSLFEFFNFFGYKTWRPH